MTAPMDPAVRRIVHHARTNVDWTDRPVEDEILHALHGTLRWGPTAANCSP